MPRPMLRSRTGCSRCKSRRQKCDEKQPNCTRCAEADITCQYTEPGPDKRREPRPKTVSQRKTPSIPAQLCLVSPFKHASHNTHLEYFLHQASSAIACHDAIRQDTCRMVVATAGSFPCMLYSALLFSAMHRASSAAGPVEACTVSLLELNAAALEALRTELDKNNDSKNQQAIAATSLMLATAELRYNAEGHGWLAHFNFARRWAASSASKTKDDAIARFIGRRLAIMQFLVALPTPWSSALQTSSADIPLTWPEMRAVGVIDGTMACTEEALEVFTWIGQMQHLERKTCLDLAVLIKQLMKRDAQKSPVLSSDVGSNYTAHELSQYRTCNTIAHSMALICVYRHGLGLGRGALAVSESVDDIIRLANSMSQTVGSHPYVCLTTALFVAGCAAEPDRRADITSLLRTHYEVTKSQSTLRTMRMLDGLWENGHVDAEFASKCSAITFPDHSSKREMKLTNSLDFIPY